MELENILKNMGMDQKETATYLAVLELGAASVYSIAKKASLKRPTVYRVLDELIKKGLVSLVPRIKKQLYVAESPERIVSELNRKSELMKRFLPNFLALYNAKKDKPQVLLFEGKEGVAQVYDRIIAYPAEVEFFSTIRDVFRVFPDQPAQLEARAREQKLRVREILTQTPADLEYLGLIKRDEFYQTRFAPKGFAEFLTDSAIFGHSVAFFSFQPTLFAVQIDSHAISQSLRTLFNLAWEAGEPYEKVMEKNKKAGKLPA